MEVPEAPASSSAPLAASAPGPEIKPRLRIPDAAGEQIRELT